MALLKVQGRCGRLIHQVEGQRIEGRSFRKQIRLRGGGTKDHLIDEGCVQQDTPAKPEGRMCSITISVATEQKMESLSRSTWQQLDPAGPEHQPPPGKAPNPRSAPACTLRSSPP